MKPEQIELIKIHMAMVEFFEETHVEQICRALPGISFNNLKGLNKHDKVRELILTTERRGRTAELVNVCQQMRADFQWQDKDTSVLYEFTGTAKRIDSEQLLTTLVNHFSLDDLRQICFYLGIDFEDIKGPHLSWNWNRTLDFGEIGQWLHGIGIDYAALSAQELDILLKQMWTENFIEFCRAENIWEQMIAVCFRLHPDAFR